MNRDDIFDMFDGTRDDYVLAAIASRSVVPKAGISRKRFSLIAVAAAMAALLVGCGVAYVLKMQNLKLGDQHVTQERWDEESRTMVYETVSRQVLTFAGLKGTPNYEASREWYEFESTYDPDRKIYQEQRDAGTLDWGSAEYTLYHAYTSEMREKVDEIIAQYGLKLRGKRVKAVNTEALYAYLNTDGVLLPDAGAKTYDVNASFYDGGWFHTDMHMKLTDNPDWPYLFLCSLYYNPKDCFDTTVCELNDTADWQEWNYTTKSGEDLLIIRSPSVWYSWVFCDRADATIALRMETILEVYSDDGATRRVMPDEQLKAVLDTIDFSFRPQPGDASLLQGIAASRELVQTCNGYTVAVREVVSDGHTTNITLGVTAPENVDLEQYLNIQSGGIYFSDISLFSPVDKSHGGGMGHGFRADNDGNANTIDYHIRVSNSVEEGCAFPQGSSWNLYLTGLHAQQWNRELAQYDTLWEQDGSWNFEITLDNGDWTELEFISEPITANVCYGWDADGNDVYRDETITSIRLRAFGAGYTSPSAMGQLDFANYKEERYPEILLTDGTEIKLDGNLDPYDSHIMIPMAKVECLKLIDGTILYPAEADPDRVTDYELEVKSAVTDGTTAQVILSLTVPYGTEMCQEDCGYSIGFDNFGDYTILMPMDRDMTSKEELMAKYAIGETLEAREDGDGRDDTVEIVYNMYVDAGQDSYVHFTPGSRWLFHIENMSAERMHYPEGELTEIEPLWTASGVRNVEFTLEEAAGPLPR